MPLQRISRLSPAGFASGVFISSGVKVKIVNWKNEMQELKLGKKLRCRSTLNSEATVPWKDGGDFDFVECLK